MNESGLQALSFEAVAKQAGLSRQLVRYYFPDIESLIVELSEYLAVGYREILIAGIVEASRVERLKFFLDFFFNLAENHPMPDNLQTYDSLVAFAVGSNRVRDSLCGQYKLLGHVIVHELAVAYPGLDGRACEELSYLFVSMMHAHWSFVATLGHSPEHNRLSRQAIERLIASYLDNPSPTPGLDRPWSRGD